jgi:peptidoglycan/LPS O-acetylase OafA/YrhL
MISIQLPKAPGAKWLPHLDMLRGMAAFAVLVGHLRALIFLSGSKQPDLSLSGQVFFFLTSLGHQAVIVFFALSGFLVGGAAFRQILEGRWWISGYWTRRLSRLGTVLVPALLVTLLCDSAGSYLFGDLFYSGALYDQLTSGPSTDHPVDLSISTFLGNLFFLQTIIVPFYGSNGPLWSLANEFWYYLIFPLALMLLTGGFSRWVSLVVGTLLIVAMLVLLPFRITALGAIWVAGALAMLFSGWFHPFLKRHPISASLGAVLIVIPSLLLSRFVASLWSDIVLGLAVCVTLPLLMIIPSPARIYEKIARCVSEISFSLYACHFPIAVLLWLAMSNANQVEFGVTGGARFVSIFSITVLLSWLFWWSSERHTLSVRTLLDKMISDPPRGSPRDLT